MSPFDRWRLAVELAEVASQMRSRVTHAVDHLDAMREARELHEALMAASTLAHERYLATLRGDLAALREREGEP